MKLVCLLGIHDYEQYECKTSDELLIEIYRELYGVNYPGTCYAQQVYIKKVCLHCGKLVDEITPAKKSIIDKLKYYDTRRNLAVKRVKENKNDYGR